MRFDFAIMNPPYDRNLHLKFLEKVIKVADKTVNISPVRWLQDPFAPYVKGSDLNKFENSVAKHIESLEIIYANTATKSFDGAAFTMNLGIYTCTEQGGYDYKNYTPLVNKVVTKVRESSWAPYSFQNYYKGLIPERPYKLNVAPIHSKDSKYPVMCQTYEKQCETLPQKKRIDGNGGMGSTGGHFEFNTDEERHNFYDAYNTLFIKWYCGLWKYDVNVVGYKLPWMDDYTKPWTNARFCEYFGITGFISDTEAEPGSEWETILETMKKYA